MGRRDHQVKIRGYRVDSREIEATLLQLSQVREATIVGDSENCEHRIVAFVALNDGVEFDESELRDRLRTYLPEWKIPTRGCAFPVSACSGGGLGPRTGSHMDKGLGGPSL